jgi:formylglycine-generating enzyme required for sulfatase activity
MAISRILEDGDGLVLIDADTIVSPSASVLLQQGIERLIDRYPNNRYVVTCRTHMLDALFPLDGFSTYSLPPLNDEEVETCIARWYPVVTQDSQLAPDILAERISILQGRMRGDEYLRNLVNTPLALALYVLVCAENDPHPPDRALILRSLLKCMLGRHSDESGDASPDVARYTTLDEQIRLLQSLAMALHVAQGSDAGRDTGLRQSQVESLLGNVLQARGVERQWAIQQIVPYLLTSWQHQGLLIQSDPPTTYQLPWRPLREYLAARALVVQPAFLTDVQHLRHESYWRDLLLLATHELTGDSAPVVALALPRLLLNSATGVGAVRDILLASECLIAVGKRAEVESTLHDKVRNQLLHILNDRAVPLEDRRRAGLLLGHLGDQRFVGLLPPVAQIAAGSYLFGSREGFDDEGPQQRVDVPAFAIAIYPVTHQEYARFLASTPDYPQPYYWYDGRLDNPSQPIVGVTWHDANAYCGWLTIELHKAGLLAPDLVVRLPSEVEWEKAAAWNPQQRVKRRYPWGDRWSSWRANTAEGRGAWLTLPVGCYPEGVSAYGVHDLIGNVWEWTANRYASYPGARMPFQETESYTLRGLSCASLPTHARCTYRSRLPASYWRYHVGFRIVLARPLQTFAEEQQVRRHPKRTKQ